MVNLILEKSRGTDISQLKLNMEVWNVKETILKIEYVLTIIANRQKKSFVNPRMENLCLLIDGLKNVQVCNFGFTKSYVRKYNLFALTELLIHIKSSHFELRTFQSIANGQLGDLKVDVQFVTKRGTIHMVI